MGKFVITTRANDEFQFNLLAENGKVILTSQGYSSKSNCEKGIESVRTNSNSPDAYERNESANAKHYFNLKAANGQVIGTSQMYESTSSMENGILSVMKNAPAAELEALENV